LVEYSGRYWKIPYYPWLMRNGRHLDWRKIVFAKVSALGVVPCKSVLVEAHKVVHKIPFCGPKEIALMRFVDN
jgi:hypothetical protein